ncbi:MAG: hypothetical protein GTO45_29605 [Candidatus Aminicenantes bacterium]|nr:hypothetical protein [Candidatus Aminicenantes bacterium]NIM82950.1 hypothetical protein [Candidatus Aminicenantes bacterium]NIN22327.1 hypothetical protein [Candidatus Aminicenantes bacterium]NIN46095.1 hypothetical protein [Candidatus Aminicenantes bacterium]NIN88931.1 hypothetical protein [Candidatus Aminicenantes bacterium]
MTNGSNKLTNGSSKLTNGLRNCAKT